MQKDKASFKAALAIENAEGKKFMDTYAEIKNEAKKMDRERRAAYDKGKPYGGAENYRELVNSYSSLSNRIEGNLGGGQASITSFSPIARQSIASPYTLLYTQLGYIHKSCGIVRTTIEEPVLDAFRGGVDLESVELGEKISDIIERAEDTDAWPKYKESFSLARLFGGSGLMAITDQDPATPLDLTRIKGRRLRFHPVSRWEIVSPYKLPEDSEYFGGTNFSEMPYFNNPNSDCYIFYGNKVHKSRIITMTSGHMVPWWIRWQLQGWGYSEMETLLEPINFYFRTINLIYELMHEGKVDVYKIKGLRNMLMTEGGTEKAQRRLMNMNRLKSYLNAIALDVGDEFEQKQITWAGLAEIWRESRIEVSCSTRTPMLVLFGQSSDSGLNKSSEEVLQVYHGMIGSQIREPSRSGTRKMLDIISANVFGDTFKIDVKFKPLQVLGAVEEEAVKTSQQARYQNLWRDHLITDQELALLVEKSTLLPIPMQAALDGQTDAHAEMIEEQMPQDEGGDSGEE